MRVATGMLSVLALWSGLAMAQSAALTLPREDGSSRGKFVTKSEIGYFNVHFTIQKKILSLQNEKPKI